MSASSRTAILNKIHKVLKKHYKPFAPPAGRSLLDHLVYACCLEDARPEAADEAFAKLQPPCYIDWNEVRVTSKMELADEVTDKLPNPLAAATSIKQALQGVFETHFAFDIEFLKKQNLGKSEKDISAFVGDNPFIVGYMVQHALGGHAIPCSQGAMDVMYMVGAITDAEYEKHVVPGIERAIPKAKGIEFASLLHQLGADFHASPQSQRLRAILLEIDPEAKDRFPKRSMPKKEAPVDKDVGGQKKPGPHFATPAESGTGKKAPQSTGKVDPKSASKAPAKPPAAKPESANPKIHKPEPARPTAVPRLAKKKPR